MPDQLQLRGGTTAQHTSFTGASKEVTVDTTKKTAVVHDGSTVGGVPLLREDGSNSALTLGSAGTPSIKFTGDSNSGVFSPGADQVAISTGGTSRLAVSTTAVSSTLAIDHPLGAVGTPSITFTGDTNTGIFSPGADQVAISTNGVERVKFGTTATEVVFNDTGVNYDFRIEGDTVDSLFFVDASADCVGIATSSPSGANLVIATDSQGGTGIKLIGKSANGGAEIDFRNNANSVLNGFIEFNNNGGILTTVINAPLVFRTNNTERAQIDSSGRLLVGTSTQVGNVNGGILQLGSGITFPATPVAATDVNTLDDYEEGTWLPNVGGTATYTTQSGFYTKIGNIVHVKCNFTINVIGTGSTSLLSGLPFPSANLSTVQSICVGYYAGLANSITWLSGYVDTNASTLQFTGNSTAATTIQSNGFVLFANSTQIIFSASYRAA